METTISPNGAGVAALNARTRPCRFGFAATQMNDPDLLLCPQCIGVEFADLHSVIIRAARQLPGNPDAAEAILSEVRDANNNK